MYQQLGDRLDDLAARAQAGDRAAVESVVGRVWRFVRRLAFRLVVPGTQVDDLTGEAFAALPACLAKWDRQKAGFLTYFGTVAGNAMRDFRAKSRRSAALVRTVDGEQCDAAAPLTSNASREEAIADVWEALDQLPAELREVIVLRRGLTGDRLDIRQTARRMRVAGWVAQALYHAAMNELRDRLGAKAT